MGTEQNNKKENIHEYMHIKHIMQTVYHFNKRQKK